MNCDIYINNELKVSNVTCYRDLIVWIEKIENEYEGKDFEMLIKNRPKH